MWGARRDRWAATLFVIALALWGGFFWNFAQESQDVAVFWPPFLTFLIGSGFAGGLVFFSYWLQKEDALNPRSVRNTVLWGIAGGAFLMAVQELLILLWLAEGRSGGEPLTQVLISGSVGTTTGVLIGYSYYRAQADAIRARQRSDALSFLNATLRHELLNSLNIIQGRLTRLSAQVAEEDEIPADEIQDSIQLVDTRSTEMADVIQNSQVFAETFAGDTQLHPVPLQPCLADRIEEIRGAFPAAEVTADIPPDIAIKANETVTHLFDNLLENAIEHNDKDLPQVTITVETTADHVVVDVADNGPGIPDSEKASVFEREAGRTHGFGLYLTKTLVDLYDAAISIHDNDPEGTVFRVCFQRAE